MTKQIPYALEISFDMKSFTTLCQKNIKADREGYSAYKALESFKEEVLREVKSAHKGQVLVLRNLETDTIVERIISTGEILK